MIINFCHSFITGVVIAQRSGSTKVTAGNYNKPAAEKGAAIQREKQAGKRKKGSLKRIGMF